MFFHMKTKRLLFNKPTEADLKDLASVYTDPQVREFLGGHLNEISALKKAKQIILNSSDQFWVIKQFDLSFVGIIELDHYHDTKEAEVSYQILPKYWCRGYATEALNKVINIAFSDLKLSKVVAETQKRNRRSIQLLEKNRFEKVSELTRFGCTQLVFEKLA